LNPGANEWIRRAYLLEDELAGWSNKETLAVVERMERTVAALRTVDDDSSYFSDPRSAAVLAYSLLRLASMRKRAGAAQAALDLLAEAAGIARKLDSGHGGDENRRVISSVYASLAEAHLAAGNFDQARQTYEASLRDRRGWFVRETDKRKARLDIARLYLKASEVCRSLADLDAARKHCADAFEGVDHQAELFREENAKKNLQRADPEIAVLFADCGAAFLAVDEKTKALKAYEEALRALEPSPPATHAELRRRCQEAIGRLK
jgi:tetratricopeptide (TPR) repeat protein